MKRITHVLGLVLAVHASNCLADQELAVAEINRAHSPAISGSQTEEEGDQVIAVEAEDFYRQTRSGVRKWHRVVPPDGNEAPAKDDTSGGVYIQCLPDTRRTHDDKLIAGENFSNLPGAMAVLHYRVNIDVPGRYYVWVRAFSTGTEDNGLHTGINGQWPESGQRLQ